MFSFNSIKVRLEQLVSECDLAAKKFQFHKGTIRTLNMFFCFVYIPQFQFHKGTIRTSVHTIMPSFLLSFNSIKVRLEQTAAEPSAGGYKFQFHKGTIRTILTT